MPHFLCPGCGHGIALRALLWAVHDLGIDKDKLAVVSGIGCAGRLSAYIDANTFHVTHGRPLAYATGLGAGAARSARRRHHRRRRLPRDRRQSSDPRLPAQSQAHLPDAQQRDLRHDRRPGVADHVGDAADDDDAARQPGAAFRRLRARGRGRRGFRRPRSDAPRAQAQGTDQGRARASRASPSSRCCPTARRSSDARTTWARRPK